jgi:hypothetical protein
VPLRSRVALGIIPWTELEAGSDVKGTLHTFNPFPFARIERFYYCDCRHIQRLAFEPISCSGIRPTPCFALSPRPCDSGNGSLRSPHTPQQVGEVDQVPGDQVYYLALALYSAPAGQQAGRQDHPPLASESPAQTSPQHSARTLSLRRAGNHPVEPGAARITAHAGQAAITALNREQALEPAVPTIVPPSCIKVLFNEPFSCPNGR